MSDVAGRVAFSVRDSRSWVAVQSSDPAATLEELEVELEGLDAELVDLTTIDDAAMIEMDRARVPKVGGPAQVLVGTIDDLSRLASLAPHVWSLVGPDYYEVDGNGLDVDARLASMREETGMTDEQVLALASEDRLPKDPIFAEWLALLGRGELGGA